MDTFYAVNDVKNLNEKFTFLLEQSSDNFKFWYKRIAIEFERTYISGCLVELRFHRSNRLRNLTLPLSLSQNRVRTTYMYTNFGCLKIEWSTIFFQYCVCSERQKRHLSSCCDAENWQRQPFDIKCQIFLKLLQMDIKNAIWEVDERQIHDSSLIPPFIVV